MQDFKCNNFVFDELECKANDANVSNQEDSDNVDLILPSMISSESEDSDQS